jgi:hypothetical protein
VQGWVENDFHLTLTKRQRIACREQRPVSLPLATTPGQRDN